ncbi:hypothetical protein [Phocaeicola plebeius]|uniref:hypothetical protein n=1 Tax=Phocaeicola plebeius TaxID=310297 RepID=UPI00307C4D6A
MRFDRHQKYIKFVSEKHRKHSLVQNAHPGDTIHLICKVSDNGVPSLTRYKRIIIRVDY